MKRTDLKGTLTLVLHALKVEWPRYAIWFFGMFALMVIATYANGQFSGEEMRELVILSVGEPGMRMLVSPIRPEGIEDISRFVFFRFSFVISILVAIMSVQIVNRLTRLEEDTKRAEMVATSGAGRYAQLFSALIVGVLVNLAIAFALTLGLVVNGVEVSGSIVAGLSYGALGIVFAGVAALTAQLSGNASASSGLSAIVFLAVFVVNALSNVTGNVHEDALGFESSFLAWFSPMGWVQEVYPFDDRNLWIFFLFASLFVLLSFIAFFLVDKRDVGRGILPDKRGRGRAPGWMKKPLGLAYRLHRGAFFGWLIPIAFVGAAFGAATGDLGETFEDHEFFGEAFTEAAREMPFILIAVATMMVAFYARLALLRMRKEETDGPLDNVLSTPLSRTKWMASHVLLAVLGSFTLVMTMAFFQGLVVAETSSDLGEQLLGGVIQYGALFMLAGLVVMLFGLIPKQASAVSLAVLLYAILAGSFFGPILDLPEFMKNLSPYTHAKFLPENASALRVLTMYGLGIALGAVGFIAFRKRNMVF